MIKIMNEVDFSGFESSGEYDIGLGWEDEITLKDMLKNSLFDDIIGKRVLDYSVHGENRYTLITDDRSKYLVKIVERGTQCHDDDAYYIETADGLCQVSLYKKGLPEQTIILQGCKKIGIIDDEDKYDCQPASISEGGTQSVFYNVIAFDRLDGWRIFVGNEEAIYSFIEQYGDKEEYDVKEFSERINGEQMYYIIQEW